MLLIYQIGIRILYLAILLASPFSRRAAGWIKGRRATRSLTAGYVPDPARPTLWMHVSSLGEFEQGRPVLERWKQEVPDGRILLSFYSPSGFNIRKNYPLADLVFYLPPDTPGKMNRLLDQIRPDLFILVKYDFWPNLLQALKLRSIPSYLISAHFRPDQYLFTRWGRVFLRQFEVFRWIFVQDSASEQLMKNHHFEHVVIAGDTRVDAVMSHARQPITDNRQTPTVNRQPPTVDRQRILIGGSTWPPEEKMLARLWKSEDFKELRADWRLVIAPHDISEAHLVQIEKMFNGEVIRFSRITGSWADTLTRNSIILIDSIGLLSSLYAYASVAFIGGGFGKGIHNILEPAAHGLPVLFGPKWQRFREAEALISLGAAFPVSDFNRFSSTVKRLCSDVNFLTESGNLAVSYMKSQMGSSDLIIRYLLEKW